MVVRLKFLIAASALGAAFVGLGTGAPEASAHGPRWRPAPPPPIVSVSLVDGHGTRLPAVEHGGQTFVAGEHGDRYEVRIHNNTADRLEIVLSVDGRDAVSGRLADFRKARGYVVDPFDDLVIDGFRTSLDAVAAFRFTTPGDSFAGRSGTPQHAGIVSVAVFKERANAIAHGHRRAKSAESSHSGSDPGGGRRDRPGASAPSSATPKTPSSKTSRAKDERAHADRQELGTEFGEHRESRVRQVSFVRARAERPDLLSTLRYDSAHALADRGVPIFAEPVFASPPPNDGWPGAVDDRFTAPPPRRRR